MKRFTIKELAEELERSQDFIRDEISKRRIAFHRLGRRLYVTQSDLDAYLQRSRTPAFAERKPKEGK
jgi:excisionase family DNA binding protein